MRKSWLAPAFGLAVFALFPGPDSWRWLFGCLANSAALVLMFGAAFQFCVLLLNTSIWIYAPELYPTRVRAFGTAFILALGTMAGAAMPLIAGRVFDQYGIGGMFGMMAGMYAVFALVLQFAPGTFGRALDGADDEPGGEPGNASRHPAGQPAASQHS